MSEENKSCDVQLFTSAGITQLELMIKNIPEAANKIIAPNTTGTIMGIEFSNLLSENGFPISTNALKFDIEDKNINLIVPLSVMSGFRIRNDDTFLGEAKSFSHNPIDFTFLNPLSIDAQEMIKLTTEVDFIENFY